MTVSDGPKLTLVDLNTLVEGSLLGMVQLGLQHLAHLAQCAWILGGHGTSGDNGLKLSLGQRCILGLTSCGLSSPSSRDLSYQALV